MDWNKLRFRSKSNDDSILNNDDDDYVNDSPIVIVPAERAVSVTVQQGIRDIVLHTAVGTVVGGLIGVVLARSGGQTAVRKVVAGLGGGTGAGYAWTTTNVQLESLVSSSSSLKNNNNNNTASGTAATAATES